MFVSYEHIVEVVEAAAVALLCLGLTISTLRFLYGVVRRQGADVFRQYRRNLGRTLQFTLEFLIAADIIETVAVDSSLESLAMLGVLVLIRTFLSFSLEVEVSGHWPWQTAKTPATED